MKPITKKNVVPPKSFSKKAPLPKVSTQDKPKIICHKTRTRTPPGSHPRMNRASIRGLSLPNKTGEQSSISPTQHKLDQLAFIAAILALIAAAIGLYIAWKTLILPNVSGTVVTF